MKPVSGNGRLLWHRLGAKTIELINQNVHVEAVRDDIEALVLDAEVLDSILKDANPGKKAREVEIKIIARLKKHAGNPKFKELGERLEKIREKHEQGLINSLEFLKAILEVAKETVEAEKQIEPEEEEDRARIFSVYSRVLFSLIAMARAMVSLFMRQWGLASHPRPHISVSVFMRQHASDVESRSALGSVGIFDKLEKALAFDSAEINAIVKDIGLLKSLFKAKMADKVPGWLKLIVHHFNDKDVDGLIEHFRDKERRKEFFKEYKEIEMLYEIISPDAFLRPFIDDYTTVSKIYEVVRKAYTKRVYVDRAFQKKTNELVQGHIGATLNEDPTPYVAIDKRTLEAIAAKEEGKATKVINLVKAIEKSAEEQSDDPFLVAMAERARAVQEAFEDRQSTTEKALEDLLAEVAKNEQRKKAQAEKGLDGLSYFVLCKLTEDGIPNAEAVRAKIREAFAEHPSWKDSDAELRELRKDVTFAVFSEEEDLEKVTATVEALFNLLQKAFRK